MNKVIGILLLAGVILTACNGTAPDVDPPAELPVQTNTPESAPAPTVTPTDIPLASLTICTTSLPETLFPYSGEPSPAKDRILALLFPPGLGADGDAVLEKMPAIGDGDLRLEPMPIRRGQTVVDARGELVSAVEGTRLRPSGCREADCVITWDGVTPLEMDQMVVDFQLRADLVWSDGTPLTAADSVFSFRLASSPDSPRYGWAEDHTLGYSALDEHNLAWRGYPGFASPHPERFFWRPLPAHLFAGTAGFDEVAADARWTGTPPVYGSFTLADWDAGALRLVNQAGATPSGEGWLAWDEIVFRSMANDPQAGWEALQAGTCDVLDASFRLEGEPELLAAIQADGSFELKAGGGDVWTQLVFGIRPAAYDALDTPLFADRPDYFGDMRTRQGIAACVDREGLLAATTQGLGAAWPSFVPPEASSLGIGEGISYDAAAGAALLEAAGWVDPDGDPAGARAAQGVANVFDGTPLSLDLLVGPSPFHQDLAGMIQVSLGACGVDINVVTLPPAELYAPGPDGPLFGRAFDLALIAWQPLPTPDCGYYHSWAVPAAENNWIGTNIAGLADGTYDQACAAAALALPGEGDGLIALAEAAFVDLLPAVPLVTPPTVEVWGIVASE